MENLQIVVFKTKLFPESPFLYCASNDDWAKREKGRSLLIHSAKTISELIKNIKEKTEKYFPDKPYEIHFIGEGMNSIKVDSLTTTYTNEGLSQKERMGFWIELSKKH